MNNENYFRLETQTHKERNQELLDRNIDPHIEIYDKTYEGRNKNFWVKNKDPHKEI